HTRFSRDWSSDVCSSDLPGRRPRTVRGRRGAGRWRGRGRAGLPTGRRAQGRRPGRGGRVRGRGGRRRRAGRRFRGGSWGALLLGDDLGVPVGGLGGAALAGRGEDGGEAAGSGPGGGGGDGAFGGGGR